MKITIEVADSTQIPQISQFLGALYLELGEERASLHFLNEHFLQQILTTFSKTLE